MRTALWPRSLSLSGELLCILRVQFLPAAELQRIGTYNAAEWLSVEEVIEDVEADVPSGRAHRDEAAIDIGPQCEASSVSTRLKVPSHVESAPVVREQSGSVGLSHRCFGNVRAWCADGGETRRGAGFAEVGG